MSLSGNDFPDWLAPLWQRVTGNLDRLPHALLLTGAQGSGKRLFAERFAQRLLCTTPLKAGEFACGHCPSCKWFADQNHPDMHRMVPASEEGEGKDDAPEADPDKKEKAKSAQILIEQVRAMQGLLEIGSHQGGRRIILIDPAEAMNMHTANALLKSLEEPPIDAVFLLICHAPARLLPTIRSRCQVWPFPCPDTAQALAWLDKAKVKNAAALLGFCSGLPLAALELAQSPMGEARNRFARDMAALASGDPLKLAGEWEAWLKSKAAQEMGLTLTILMSWLQRWLSDGAQAGLGGSVRFFTDYETQLKQSAQGRGEQWIACYNEMSAYRKVAQHPLNPRLFLEDVLLRVMRSTSAARA